MWNLQAIQCIASGRTGNLPYHVQEPDPGSGGNYEKNKARKKTTMFGWRGFSEKEGNLVGKGQSENLDIPPPVHMKLISLKKPRHAFFSFPVSPCLHRWEAGESAFCL